jgi:hypothetical protein
MASDPVVARASPAKLEAEARPLDFLLIANKAHSLAQPK